MRIIKRSMPHENMKNIKLQKCIVAQQVYKIHTANKWKIPGRGPSNINFAKQTKVDP
jgi:hypothetical protein